MNKAKAKVKTLKAKEEVHFCFSKGIKGIKEVFFYEEQTLSLTKLVVN